MIHVNFLIIAIAALIPLAVGFVWYNPKVFGTAWMTESGVTAEDAMAKRKHMPRIFVMTYILSFFLGIGLTFMTIHQFGVFSTLLNEPGFNEPGSAMNNYFMDFMAKYGSNFRTFKHGLSHGVIGGFIVALPVLAVNAMFEFKKFKYIAINAGYWIVCMGLMGGVICAFS